MKIIFLGTGHFSRLVAEKIITSKHEIVAIVAQPDKVNARNNKIVACEMKTFALEHSIPIHQFTKLNLEGEEILRSYNADCMVTASYGQIIRQNILDICPIYNVHGSLLPDYRGAAPVQWAILNGEKQTGVTIMKTELGLDCGEMYVKKVVDILPTDVFDTLLEKLGAVGGNAIVEFLDNYKELIAKGIPQGECTKPTSKIKDDLAHINFDMNASEICKIIRALNSCLPTYFIYNNTRYRVFFAEEIQNIDNAKVGEIIKADARNGLIIGTKSNCIKLIDIQPEGKKVMKAKDYCNSCKFIVGDLIQ